MRVSILVATCNRCDKLRMLLDNFKANASARPTEAEVLVIDNNSSDATRQVVEEYASLKNPVIRYLLESQPGKSRALNAGIRQARGEILAFTDDDCIPGPGWVEAILKEFDSDPELSVLGGRVELYDEKDLRQAVLLSKDRTLVTNTNDVFHPTVTGGNLAFRATDLELIGGLDPLLGPGSPCKAAEDIDLIYRALNANLKIVYSPDALIFHNHGRKSEAEENKTSFAYAVGRGGLYVKYILRSDFQVVRITSRELYDLAKTLTKGIITRTKFPYHRLAFPAIFLGAYYYCQARFSQRR